MADILAACGGTTGEIRGYLTGGYGGAWVGPSCPAVRWDVTSVAAAGGTDRRGSASRAADIGLSLVQLAAVGSWLRRTAQASVGRAGSGPLPSPPTSVGSPAANSPRSDWARLRDRLRLIVRRGGVPHARRPVEIPLPPV